MEFLSPCKEMLGQQAPYWHHDLADAVKLDTESPLCTFAKESLTRLFFSLLSQNEALVWRELWRISKLLCPGPPNVFVHPHVADLWEDLDRSLTLQHHLGCPRWVPQGEFQDLALFDFLGVRGGQLWLNNEPDVVVFSRFSHKKRTAHVDLVLKPYLAKCGILLPGWKNEDLRLNRDALNACLGLGMLSTMERPSGLLILFQNPVLEYIKDCKHWALLAPSPEPLESLPAMDCTQRMLYLMRSERYKELGVTINALEDMHTEIDRQLQAAVEPSAHAESWNSYQATLEHRDFLQSQLTERKENLLQYEAETDNLKQVYHIRLLLDEVTLLDEEATLSEKRLKDNEPTWIAEEEAFQISRKAEAERFKYSLAVLRRHIVDLQVQSDELCESMRNQEKVGVGPALLDTKLCGTAKAIVDASDYDNVMTTYACEELELKRLMSEVVNATRHRVQLTSHAKLIEECRMLEKKAGIL
eukprot:GEMP01037872.1.p1 GENE.GEMP01037872.1~~GEMP01037872.1.p1  ORF type:complete len:481 (+),score=83.30 GEMP01037872.1:28-1443(+)